MKRDMTVIRQILLEIESWPNRLSTGLRPLHLDGIDDAVTAEHVHQLVEAGYLQAIQITPPGAPYEMFAPRRLTSAGHDFLDRLRAEAHVVVSAAAPAPAETPLPEPALPPAAPVETTPRVRYPAAVPFDRGRSNW